MGWNYAAQWFIVLPLEIVGASITFDFWNFSIPKAVWITIFFFIVIAINLFGVEVYGETEFVFSTIKISAMIAFM